MILCCCFLILLPIAPVFSRIGICRLFNPVFFSRTVFEILTHALKRSIVHQERLEINAKYYFFLIQKLCLLLM